MNITPELIKEFRRRGACAAGIEELSKYETYQAAWDVGRDPSWMIVSLVIIGLPRPDLLSDFAASVGVSLPEGSKKTLWATLYTFARRHAEPLAIANALRAAYSGFDFTTYQRG